jgi:hypothetical protein
MAKNKTFDAVEIDMAGFFVEEALVATAGSPARTQWQPAVIEQLLKVAEPDPTSRARVKRPTTPRTRRGERRSSRCAARQTRRRDSRGLQSQVRDHRDRRHRERARDRD